MDGKTSVLLFLGILVEYNFLLDKVIDKEGNKLRNNLGDIGTES